MQEKDFSLYVSTDDGSSEGVTDETLGTVGEGVVEEVAGGEAGADEALEELAADAGGEVVADEVGEEPTEAPAEEVVEDVEKPASGDDLQKMIDELDLSLDKAEESSKEVEKIVEEEKSEPQTDMVPRETYEKLLSENTNISAELLKANKTLDIIKTEYEKTLNDKISLEYGTASDSKIISMVNDDPNLKALIAAKLDESEGAGDKLAEAWKLGREDSSGAKVDELISKKKEVETDALVGGEDVSDNLSVSGGNSLYTL